MAFEVGDAVTPQSPKVVNFGKMGVVVRVAGKEIIVNFDGVWCLYFSGMVEAYEKS